MTPRLQNDIVQAVEKRTRVRDADDGVRARRRRNLFLVGIINLLAPSGGGQWAVQGPVMMEAAQAMGANNAATAVAVQIGDQWTNMVQPFWILPVLAISGLKLRDVMGYMVLILVFLGIVIGCGRARCPRG